MLRPKPINSILDINICNSDFSFIKKYVYSKFISNIIKMSKDVRTSLHKQIINQNSI